MKTNISSLKANLSKYLHAARAGKTVIVTDRNVPIAKVVPFASIETELIVASPEGETLADLCWPPLHVAGAELRFFAERE